MLSFSALPSYISLFCLSPSPPLTFQHDPLLLPPDKASIVSQMLFNMESLSQCPSYGAIQGYRPPLSLVNSMFAVMSSITF